AVDRPSNRSIQENRQAQARPTCRAQAQPEPINDLPDDDAQHLIEAAQTAIAATACSANHPAAPHPKATADGLLQTREWRNMKLSTDALMNAITQMGVPAPASAA
ncbi:MAG: hypothetical protein QOD93_833, partial [Acetobacteraceae bacterium]|nr:hypothetical protein [Acetobacteraceae bacterium]